MSLSAASHLDSQLHFEVTCQPRGLSEHKHAERVISALSIECLSILT